MKCPACSHELMEFVIGGVTVDACEGGCAGIWFDAFELQRVDDQNEIAGDTVLCLQRDPKTVVDFTRKRECPRCAGIKLKRQFFNPKLRIEVDHCPHCGGYWLDAGELEKIRAEKSLSATAAAGSPKGLTMEAIRFLYRQKLEQRPPG
jgi:Zn-finger nucleic acid-binding protein